VNEPVRRESGVIDDAVREDESGGVGGVHAEEAKRGVLDVSERRPEQRTPAVFFPSGRAALTALMA
jgi:hypothetical protein